MFFQRPVSLSLSPRIFNKLILFEVTVLISGKALYTVTSTLHNAFTLHKRSSLRNSSNRFSKVHSLLLFFNGFRTQIPIHEFQSNVYIRVYIYIYSSYDHFFFNLRKIAKRFVVRFYSFEYVLSSHWSLLSQKLILFFLNFFSLSNLSPSRIEGIDGVLDR